MTQTVEVPVSFLTTYGLLLQGLRDVLHNSTVRSYVAATTTSEWAKLVDRAENQLEAFK
jgi:hypothetical protein